MDEGSGDPGREGLAEIGGDQGQHHVEPGHRAATGQAGAVDMKAVGEHVDGWEPGGKPIEVFPMGRGVVAIQQACRRHQPGAAVEPGDPSPRGRDPAQARAQGRGILLLKLETGDDQEQIASRYA